MRLLLLPCLLLLLPVCFASEAPPELVDLLRTGEVDLQVTGTGGYSGGCVRVEVRNRRLLPLDVLIPAGWRFVSEDTSLQDLLVVEDALVALAPGAVGSTTCRAFCCEAARSSPGSGSRFDQGAPAGNALQEFARYIGTQRIPDEVVQQAVWVVSDGICIGSVNVGEVDATRALQERLATITGRAIPWYSTQYAHPVAGQVFNPEVLRVAGAVDVIQRHAGLLTIVVKDAQGNTVHTLDAGRILAQGRFSVDVLLTVKGWRKGRYALCFATDGVLIKRQEFSV